MPVTKKLKPVYTYQQWIPSGISEPLGIRAGDIIGVKESLGNRSARSITVEAIGGDAVIRFNVCTEIHAAYGEMHESWVGLGQGTARGPSPLLLDTIEESRPDIHLTTGTTTKWTINDIGIDDIKIVSCGSGIRITAT